ncbi:Molybdopterin adenylyltransferase [Paenibacillus konkukensis]|uniref:Molybdopterin adenylyltransferase n=1 Tax=Paenibacillus konkukensis TaxID=2020716 RepID=A0ABY4RQL0_9BACL|nr:Molybdopterin adenylyltransferase [Paenibacillus konkukensis]
MRWKVAILTASDRGSRGEREDTSAQVIRELIEEEINGEIIEYRVVPDEKDEIMAALIEMTDYFKVDLILTTGGTGLAPAM